MRHMGTDMTTNMSSSKTLRRPISLVQLGSALQIALQEVKIQALVWLSLGLTHVLPHSMDWFKGNLQETIDFPIKYGGFLQIFPSTNPLPHVLPLVLPHLFFEARQYRRTRSRGLHGSPAEDPRRRAAEGVAARNH